jgi:two-component system phosphate regulon sensor histidine kinase PhoR
LLARDITEREQLEITRRDFVANISHELRTPLTVIQGFLETFDGNPAENPQLLSRGVKLMSDQSRRMNRLITDLLALSRLETSNAPPEEVIYMSKLIDDVRTEGQALSTSNHEFEIQALPDLNILGAEDEIRSAVSNLVSNAVRYSPAGGKISIVWSLINGEPVFSCEDQGVGIPLEHLGRITERFYRVDKSRSQETGGTGLGLAIVKHVLNRHGATLRIDSEPRRGSKFTIHFLNEKIAPQKSLFS